MSKIIEQTYAINAPRDIVWNALTDAKHIEEWSKAPAVMDSVEGHEFKLWNGDIHGKNTEVIDNEELIQEWYSGKWEKPSTVTFTLIERGNKTVINLLHEDVPDDEAESIEDGWREYYMDPLKEYVENELV